MWRSAFTGRAAPIEDDAGLWTRASQLAVIGLGLAAFLYVLDAWSAFFVPVTLSLVIGVMLTPILTRLENWGLPPALVAAILLIGLAGLFYLAALLFMVPLSEWFARAPEIGAELRSRLQQLRQSLSVLYEVEERLQEAATDGRSAAQQVAVTEGGMVESVLKIAPPAIGQIVLFTGSLYFYVATRQRLRLGLLSLCVDRAVKLRAARIMRDTEKSISRYLLTISVVNVGLGIATGLAMWMLDMPTPAFWGALAAVFNFIPYLGPWMLGAILAAVALVSFDTVSQIVAPPLAFLALNIVESQLLTPSALGRSLTLNPFLVFLALGFWLYMWGPIGAFLAVPFLILCAVALTHLLPRARRPRRGVGIGMEVPVESLAPRKTRKVQLAE
ncbi:MAG: AI-2E family transporter [Hyphomicrobiales bacterium]|nr:AI-2E family transporter [Hyphomicrobiales bacterium]